MAWSRVVRRYHAAMPVPYGLAPLGVAEQIQGCLSEKGFWVFQLGQISIRNPNPSVLSDVLGVGWVRPQTPNEHIPKPFEVASVKIVEPPSTETLTAKLTGRWSSVGAQLTILPCMGNLTRRFCHNANGS